MAWIAAVMREIAGLFVDDGRFAVTILAWVGLCALVLPRLPITGAWDGPVLFAGLALILLESAVRRARR
jgi:hypothetical protein